ncbi:hypothetical protein CBL_08665 [Carabus blaptoides fortunei]
MRPPKPGNNSFRPWASCRQRHKVLGCPRPKRKRVWAYLSCGPASAGNRRVKKRMLTHRRSKRFRIENTQTSLDDVVLPAFRLPRLPAAFSTPVCLTACSLEYERACLVDFMSNL